MESTMPPSAGRHPPESPVPAPRATKGSSARFASRTTAATCSAEVVRLGARGGRGGGAGGAGAGGRAGGAPPGGGGGSQSAAPRHGGGRGGPRGADPAGRRGGGGRRREPLVGADEEGVPVVSVQ